MHYILVCLCLLSIAACDSTGLVDDLVDEQTGEEVIEEGPADRSFVDEATALTNAARAKSQQCGNTAYPSTTALTWNDQLAEAALAHSKDMAARNYFDHTNQQGEGPGVRISRAGYVARTWGENIAAGYGTLGSAIAGWVNSPGHCANIMNGSFSEFAIAVAESSSSSYGTYWTMVLAAPR